jgi:hypothetical protein
MGYSFDENIVSDLHKDARGHRPGPGWWTRWSSMSADMKQQEWDSLLREAEWEAEEERRAEAAAQLRWEAHIRQLVESNGISRARALRWDMQAMEANDDVGYYCYLWGISYRNETEIKDCISRHRTEIMA